MIFPGEYEQVNGTLTKGSAEQQFDQQRARRKLKRDVKQAGLPSPTSCFERQKYKQRGHYAAHHNPFAGFALRDAFSPARFGNPKEPVRR